jgi:hypothetical protein
MSRVAIVGSCITRDLWPIRGDGIADLIYISRTSLPSLFASPVSGFQPAPRKPAGLGKHQHRALVADLTKTGLAALVAFRPTHIIIDFIDERFDLLWVNGALATESWELHESGYLRQRALKGLRRIPRLSAACERLWSDAAGEFSALIRGTPLRRARLILHSARWAERSLGADGRERPVRDVQVLPGRATDLTAHNALLARYEEIFTEVAPALDIVEAPEHRIADEAHQWGLSPFHYVPGYYRSIWRQLEELGVGHGEA